MSERERYWTEKLQAQVVQGGLNIAPPGLRSNTSEPRCLMFRWTLRQTMDSRGITRYALAKKSGLAMNSVRSMYDGDQTRVDFPKIEQVIHALRELTGAEIKVEDVFVWEEK